MEPVKDDEVEEWVEEEEEEKAKEEVKKRDLSPESSMTNNAKKAPSAPVWYGERL